MKMNNTEQFARYLVHYLPENLKPERGSSLQPYMDAIEKALNSAPAVCEWKMDDVGVYESDCGKSWVDPDGLSLGDIHDIEYCHGCGRRIQIAAAPQLGGEIDEKYEQGAWKP